MRLKNIVLKNIRLIGDKPLSINVESDKNILLILGDNGYGKTTILDSIATTVAPYVSQFPGKSDRPFKDTDIHVNEQGKLSPYLTAEATYITKEQIPDVPYIDEYYELKSFRYRKGVEDGPEPSIKQIRSLASVLKERIVNEDETVNLPILAYYSTERGNIKLPERRRDFQTVFERWDCYKNCLESSTDFKRFFEWFDNMEEEERRERESRWEKGYTSPVLDAVRKAMSSFTETLSNPRIQTRPLRFIMDEKGKDGCVRELRINQLSDGYRITMAMVADIASRMAEANPNMEDPLKSPGIVLIDEVDLHLHPQWQRNILRQLSLIFPHIQFIVSTHSPIVVLGAIDLAQIVNLNKKDSFDESSSYSSVGQILLGNLFNLKTIYSPIWDDQIKQRDDLLKKSILSDDDQRKLQELDRDLSMLSFSENSDSIRARQLIGKLAEQMGIQL